MPNAHLGDITSAAGVKILQDPGLDIEYHVYDCIIDGIVFSDRLKCLEELTPRRIVHPSYLLDQAYCETMQTLQEVTDGFYAQQAEGIVCRFSHGCYAQGCRSPYMQKYKFMESEDVEVVALHEGLGKFKGTLGSMTVTSMSGVSFDIGGGSMTNEARKQVWDMKSIVPGKLATIQYPYKSAKGIPLQAQFIAWRDYE